MIEKIALASLAAVLLIGAVPAQAGVKANGLHVNGLHANGLHFNGTRQNGVKANGMRMNGMKQNGAAPGPAFAMRVVAVELPGIAR